MTIQGVIYEATLSYSKGEELHGFFVQNTRATADGDGTTSDGLWVFLGRAGTLRGGARGYTPTVGDEVVLSGQATEYFSQTQLSRPQLVRVVRRGVDVEAEVPAFEAAPPDDIEDANRYWERREGMRARVPAGSVALSGRHAFSGEDEAWVMRADLPLARRAEPYARRAFRDSHPLDNVPGTGFGAGFDDGNGYRIALGSQGLNALNATRGGNRGGNRQPVALATDATATPIALGSARTFDRLREAVVGGVSYSFGKYAVQAESAVSFERGADPSLNAPPQAPDRATEYSVAAYNVENLYDFRDDPNDACDFAGSAGCAGVKPPFDYVPASQAQYQAHIGRLARQIAGDLHAPDVLMIEEAEDQDICRVQDGAMACGTEDNADGRPDTIQELALAIQAAGGPEYQTAYDRDGADARGITCAFLFRTDRVELALARANDPLLGASPRVQGFGSGLPINAQVQNPKALNAPLEPTPEATDDRDEEAEGKGIFTRAPQVGRFRLFRERVGAGPATELYVIANHFSSRPDARVTQRKAQAKYLAALIATLQKADAAARVIAGGDLNVYPRPDDPFSPREAKKPSDQLAALYDGGLSNLWDVLVQEAPASAYTYVFSGQAQTLDHLWNTPAQRRDLVQVRVAHINADWPDDSEEFPSRRASDHDPIVARYRF